MVHLTVRRNLWSGTKKIIFSSCPPNYIDKRFVFTMRLRTSSRCGTNGLEDSITLQFHHIHTRSLKHEKRVNDLMGDYPMGAMRCSAAAILIHNALWVSDGAKPSHVTCEFDCISPSHILCAMMLRSNETM